jgi:hypothetical protein
MLSSDMSMDRQISAVTKAANFNLYRLGKIRSHLTTEATKILAHALVISRIDYANSLLAGLPKSKIKPLQSVQTLLLASSTEALIPAKSQDSVFTGCQ